MRRILLVSSNPCLANQLTVAGGGNFLIEHTDETSLHRSLAGAGVLIVDAQDPEAMARVMQQARGAAPSLPLLAIGDIRRAEVVVAAVRLGAVDYLDRDDFGPDLVDRLEMHLRVSTAERRAGRLDLVLGVDGGGGEAAFAVNLALLHAQSSGDAVLFDCGAGQGEPAQALDLKPGHGFGEAARDWDRLDRTLLTSAVARHKASGLHLLPLTVDLEARPLSPEAVERVIGSARPLFRDAVVAAGGLGDPKLMTSLIEAADTFYLLCPQRIAALGRGQRLLRQLALGKPLLQRIVLVVEDWRADIMLSEDQMRLALGLERSARLPDCRAELINAANAGRPLALSQPRSPYVQGLSRLAGMDSKDTASPAVRMLEGVLGRMRASLPIGLGPTAPTEAAA